MVEFLCFKGAVFLDKSLMHLVITDNGVITQKAAKLTVAEMQQALRMYELAQGVPRLVSCTTPSRVSLEPEEQVLNENFVKDAEQLLAWASLMCTPTQLSEDGKELVPQKFGEKQETVVPETMQLDAALKHLFKGKKIARSVWGTDSYLQAMPQAPGTLLQVVLHRKSGVSAIDWVLYAGDVLAADWVVLHD